MRGLDISEAASKFPALVDEVTDEPLAIERDVEDCVDPKDNMILECALGGNADTLLQVTTIC